MKSLFVFRFHSVVNRFAIGIRLLFQDRGERGASVFGIDVDVPGENALMRDVSSAQVKAAFHRKMSLFSIAAQLLAEDNLLGEILASDNNMRTLGTGSQRENDS